jgi:hypothetical protein
MAVNDDRSVPTVVAEKRGWPAIQSLQSIIRGIYGALHYLEGRLGRIRFRDSIDVDGEAKAETLNISDQMNVHSTGRTFINYLPVYDLASNTFAPVVAIDPGGRAGDSGDAAGEVSIPANGVLALLSLTGNMVGEHSPGEFHELEGIRFYFDNSATGGTPETSRVRPLIGRVRLLGPGSVRGAQFRAEATEAGTGWINGLAVTAVPAPLTSVSTGVQVSAEGAPGLTKGIVFNVSPTAAYPLPTFNTGIHFEDTFDATSSAIHLQTGVSKSMIRWQDIAIANNFSNQLAFLSLSNTPYDIFYIGPNGSHTKYGHVTEEVTLSLVSATTDSVANLLPADSIIKTVSVYVTETISGGGVTSFSVGDATTANRFINNLALASGSAEAGIRQWSTVLNAALNGPRQNAANPVRITTNGGIPTQGKVRVVVFYETFVPPTS